MNRRRAFGLSVVLLCGLVLVGTAWANGTPTINWDVTGGGGWYVAAAPYALHGTIGQAVVGPASDTGSELCSGFWCGAEVPYSLYLPLVLRNY